MNANGQAPAAPDWATANGDVWARRWRNTDAALEGLSPHLLSAIAACAPEIRFSAFDIGCGPGTTTLAVADAFPRAAVTACDISPALARVAEQRSTDRGNVRVLVGDAEEIAVSEGPFDLYFSRHGVMFFPDPVRAFGSFRQAANPGASIVFSCFRSWDLNPWARDLSNAAAGRELPLPGREPSGFAFAEPDHVLRILSSSGWCEPEPLAIDFNYIAGEGDEAVEHASSFLSEIGPACRIVQSLPEDERSEARARMRKVIDDHFDGSAVVFPAAAWIWRARAP